jgi:AraC-like DNA-binding protein
MADTDLPLNLPPPSGKAMTGGRNIVHARARMREKQVMEMRTAGYTYEEIAHHLGFKGPQGAYEAWKRAINRIPVQATEDFRAQEIIRLDRITETKSDFTGICDRLEKRAYEVLQTELAKRKKS